MDRDRHAESYSYIRSIGDTLKSVTKPGSFANGGPFLFPPPGLKIKGVKSFVGLPVGEYQARVIMAMCSQAPYGRGLETIVDRTVRSTWELDPSQFTITNPQWNSHLENLAAVVKKELGCDPKLKVKCELYNFLLYEQGSFFKPHRDTEKVDKMFGTLVIQLPSDYDGGELRVRHRNEEQIFDFSGSKGITNYNYAAFYADCEHELCEVTRGYRLCLVYNLVYSGDGACPVPIDNSEVVAKVVAGMREWEQDEDGLPFMAYVLHDDYRGTNLSFRHLKNGDRAKAEVLLEAEKQSEFCLFLGLIRVYQLCSVAIGCSHSDMSIEDIEKETLTVDELFSHTGKTITDIEFTRAVVIQDIFDSGPGEDDFDTYTGDRRFATLDRTFFAAALFMWPAKHSVFVTGIEKAIGSLNSTCAKLCDESDAQQQEDCEKLAKEIVAVSKNSHFHPNSENVIILLSCLKQLKVRVLLSQFFEALAVNLLGLLLCPKFREAVIELINAFGWKQLEETLVLFFESVVNREIEIVCRFLGDFDIDCISSEQLSVCQKLVDVICRALDDEQDICCCDQRGTKRSKNFVFLLFLTFYDLKCGDQLMVALQSFVRQPKRYPLHSTLVSAALELYNPMAYDGNVGYAPFCFLVSHCVTTLENRTREAPTWSLRATLTCECSCELCGELKIFLKDPGKSVSQYCTKLSNRAHLEQQLKNCRNVNCATERSGRRGRVYTLVVTKDQIHYDKRLRNHQFRLGLLDRVRLLLAEQETEPPDEKRQKLDDLN